MIWGLLAGFLWALDAVILGQTFGIETMKQMGFLRSSVLAAGLHDTASAVCVLLLCILKSICRKGSDPSIRRTMIMNADREYRRAFLCFLSAAILGGPVGMTCYLASIGGIGPGLAASITALYPAAGTAIAAITGLEKPGPAQKLGLLLCAAGAALISRTPGSLSRQPEGFLLAFLAALCWGLEGLICSLGLRHNRLSYHGGLLIRQLSSAAVYLLLLFPLLGIRSGLPHLTVFLFPDQATAGRLPAAMEGGMYGPLFLYAGLAGATGAASYLCYYKAIELKGPARAMAANVTYTGWAVLLDAIIIRTVPGPATILCVGLVFCGAILVSGIKKQKNDSFPHRETV